MKQTLCALVMILGMPETYNSSQMKNRQSAAGGF